jgi:uncharacterized protein YggE
MSLTTMTRRSAVAAVTAAALCLPVAAPAASAAEKKSSTATITVTGTGTVEVARDRARIALGVGVTRATARGAYEQLATTASAVRQAMLDAGTATGDITTTGISLYPEYVYADATRSLIGYRASTQMTVVVPIARAPQLLDTVVANGSDDVTLEGISFEASNRAAAVKKARTKAVAAARENASDLTAAAGVRIDRVLTISESSTTVTPYLPMYADRVEASLPVSGGRDTVSVTVTIVYRLR